VLFTSLDGEVGDYFKFAVSEHVLEGASYRIGVFLLVEFEGKMLFGHFADG
jgi:hypothetical protein